MNPDNPLSFHTNSADEIILESTPCLLCRSSNSSIIHTFGRLHVVACNNCKLVYLSPRVKESNLKNLYQRGDYFFRSQDTGYINYAFQEKSLRITFRRFLKELKIRGLTSGKLLEIGCGYGYFLDEAKYFFSERFGTELSEDAGNIAKKLSGVQVHVGDIGSMPPSLTNFTLVVLINVIEHIYSPVQFLSSIKQRLKDNGRIVVATPDIGSFWHLIMRKKWPSFKIPEHVAFYSRKTLKYLLQKSGFDDIQLLPFPHAFPLGTVAQKLGGSIPPEFGSRSVWLPKTMIAMSAQNSDAKN